jgi:hypothetical protein
MKELLARIESEEKTFTQQHRFPPRINELSEGLQKEIKEKVLSAVVEQGLESIKLFLRAF